MYHWVALLLKKSTPALQTMLGLNQGASSSQEYSPKHYLSTKYSICLIKQKGKASTVYVETCMKFMMTSHLKTRK